MNTKLIIKDTQNNILQTAIFYEQETLDNFIALIASQFTFGKPAYDEVIEPEKTIIHPAIEGVPAHNDIPEVLPVEEWTEIIPAVIVHHESEYILEMVDITEEVEAKRIKKEAKKTERELRVKDLSVIDWNSISNVASLKQIVKQLVKESLKDDE